MTNSTTDYWDIDGTSLQTLGWGIDRWSSGQNPPTLRGDGVELPFRVGRQFKARVPEPRTITFDMWVSQFDADGENPSESQLLTNWENLRELFWGSPGAQMTLTKREGGGYLDVSGSAVFAGGLEPDSIGMQVIRFSVDLIMLDPYFYGDQVSLSFPVGTTNTSGGILGSAPSPRYTLVIPSGTSSITVKKDTTVLSTLTATSLPGALTVTFPDLTFSGVNGAHPGYITADGPWFDYLPAATSVVVTGNTYTGTYYPAYL